MTVETFDFSTSFIENDTTLPAEYKYVFGRLGTEAVIEEIPLYGVWMSMELNVGGQFTGTFKLDMDGKDNQTLVDATIPGYCWVAVERNGICIWHGFIWTRTYSAQSKTMQIQAQSFEYYADKRIIDQNLDFEAVEQRNIFRSLWTTMQSGPSENLNINVPDAFDTVVEKDLLVLATDFQYYRDAMSGIADAADGFDWYIGVSKDGTLYRKDLRIGYPILGTDASSSMVVFEYPGSITQYYMTDSMTIAGTHTYIIGAGEGSSMVVGTYVQTTMINNGFPRWDIDVSRKDISNQTIINSIAEQVATIRKPPMPVIKLSIKGNLEPEFGTYNLGDKCRVVINDSRFPNGFSAIKRLIKWELQPQSSDNSDEASLVFEGDPDEG